jgi:hypothetical protein
LPEVWLVIVPVQIPKSFLFPFISGVPISIAPICPVGVAVAVVFGASIEQAKVANAKMESSPTTIFAGTGFETLLFCSVPNSFIRLSSYL